MILFSFEKIFDKVWQFLKADREECQDEEFKLCSIANKLACFEIYASRSKILGCPESFRAFTKFYIFILLIKF